MNGTSKSDRSLAKGIAIPLCAALAFSFGWVASPTADGGFGLSVAEAKGKGGGEGGGRGGGAGGGRGGAEGASAEGGPGNSGNGKGLGREGAPGQQADRANRGKKGLGWGDIASELKNMNAANAFKNGKVPNGAPTSNVGQIAEYQAAALEAQAADIDMAAVESMEMEIADLKGELAELEMQEPSADVDLAKSELMGQIEAKEMELAEMTAPMDREAAALESVTRGRSISEAAMAAFEGMLGIDRSEPETDGETDGESETN